MVVWDFLIMIPLEVKLFYFGLHYWVVAINLTIPIKRKHLNYIIFSKYRLMVGLEYIKFEPARREAS